MTLIRPKIHIVSALSAFFAKLYYNMNNKTLW